MYCDQLEGCRTKKRREERTIWACFRDDTKKKGHGVREWCDLGRKFWILPEKEIMATLHLTLSPGQEFIGVKFHGHNDE